MSWPDAATTAIPIAAEVIKLGVDALEGRRSTAADVIRGMFDIGVRHLPVDELQRYLTEAAMARAEAIAEAAEAAKFGDHQ